MGEVTARCLVLMGVSGSGKTEIGIRLAARMGARFVDADQLHPPANVAKMSAKIPLTDEDRSPWLDRVRSEAIESTAPGSITVLACSALKRRYRDHLRSGNGKVTVTFIHLDGSFDLIASRLAARRGHFMPPDLLRSQFQTLETPTPEEAVIVSVDQTIDEIVDEIARQIQGAA